MPTADFTCHAYDIAIGTPGRHLGLPGTTVTVIVPVGRPFDLAWEDEEDTRVHHWASVSGLHDRPAVIRHSGSLAGVQVDIPVGASRSVLGLPGGALAGMLVDGSTEGPCWLRALPEQLADTPRDRWEPLVSNAVRAARSDARDRMSSAIAHALALLSRGAPVAAVADDVGYSRRRLSTLVRVETGHDPQTFRRMARLDRARRRLVAAVRGGRQARLADVAARTGYADHAHLTRDWVALAGRTPTAWLAEEFPILQASGVGGDPD